jgi:hypothetical protein
VPSGSFFGAVPSVSLMVCSRAVSVRDRRGPGGADSERTCRPSEIPRERTFRMVSRAGHLG